MENIKETWSLEQHALSMWPYGWLTRTICLHERRYSTDLKLGGYLQLAFFVVGSPASLIIGWLADKVPRTRLFFITVLIGEGPCLATYWVGKSQ
jgi:MFS family permease